MTSPHPKLQASIDHLDNRTDPLGIPATRAKPRLASTQTPTRKPVEKPYTYLGTFNTLRYTERARFIDFDLLSGQSLRISYQPGFLTMLDLRADHTPTFQICSNTKAVQKNQRKLELKNISSIRLATKFQITRDVLDTQERAYTINPPAQFEVTFDSRNGIYDLSGDFNVQLSTKFPLELDNFLDDYLEILWDDTTQLQMDNLDPNLQHLYTDMVQRISEVSNET